VNDLSLIQAVDGFGRGIVVRIDQINEAFDRMGRADVRYRFAIDTISLRDPAA